MTNVLDWLDERVATQPEKLAFADVESSLSFAELFERTRSIGSFVAASVPARSAVACYLEKSTLAISAMLGIVRAGCCYCVVDVRQPASRARGIVDTLAAPLVLTDAANADVARSAFAGYEVVDVSDLLSTPVDDALLAARRASALDTDPLYVNFTSGSTGVPKGVVCCHRSVIDFIGTFVDTFGIMSDDVLANQAPFDFDVSVKDIYSCLACGASVQMIPREYFSIPVELMDFLADRAVTVCTWAVSAMCFVSIMGGFDYRVPSTVRLVIFSGEVMPPKQLAVWRRALPDATYVNVYGPTEVTCNCTYHVIDREYAKDDVIPMGRPFPNEHVFLLDEGDCLVSAPGVEGEICVTGTALALGYYNDSVRTAEVFVQNPLNPHYPETMYRTGDLGMLDDEGRFVYCGRKDHQIKHLGQRIELGEIDAVAHAVKGVARACTIYDARRKRILMFYTGDCAKEVLLDTLKERLPQYMVPNRIRQVDEMPLTKNGKIDRAALMAL